MPTQPSWVSKLQEYQVKVLDIALEMHVDPYIYYRGRKIHGPIVNPIVSREIARREATKPD